MTINTADLVKPAVEEPTSRCNWWSKQKHCFHSEDCPDKKDDCLHRYCCHCGERHYAELIVAPVPDHGLFYKKTEEDLKLMIWTPWQPFAPKTFNTPGSLQDTIQHARRYST